jgi:hypothetical protein
MRNISSLIMAYTYYYYSLFLQVKSKNTTPAQSRKGRLAQKRFTNIPTPVHVRIDASTFLQRGRIHVQNNMFCPLQILATAKDFAIISLNGKTPAQRPSI